MFIADRKKLLPFKLRQIVDKEMEQFDGENANDFQLQNYIKVVTFLNHK